MAIVTPKPTLSSIERRSRSSHVRECFEFGRARNDIGSEGPRGGGRRGDGRFAGGAARNGTPSPPTGPGVTRAPRATLPAVTATSEAPASFRSSSVRPGALSLVQGGIREVLSRRRLIAYLVRADLRKSGSDTLLGNLWWFMDPLLQMLVYVIFVGIILQRGGTPDYPLFVLSRDPALEVVRVGGQATASARS